MEREGDVGSEEQTAPVAATRRERVRQSLPLAAALLITAAALALGAVYREQLLGLGRFGLIGIFIINLVNNATVIVPAPFGMALTCLFADVSHPIAVGVVGGLGSALGEYTGYMAGVGGTAVLPRGRIYKWLRFSMRRAGSLVIFILALVPNPLFDVGGLLAGVLRMPPRTFLVATIAGKVLRFVLIAYWCAGGLSFVSNFFFGR
jgi:membrane protein YqaA with SNARE-associated domain